MVVVQIPSLSSSKSSAFQSSPKLSRRKATTTTKQKERDITPTRAEPGSPQAWKEKILS